MVLLVVVVIHQCSIPNVCVYLFNIDTLCPFIHPTTNDQNVLLSGEPGSDKTKLNSQHYIVYTCVSEWEPVLSTRHRTQAISPPFIPRPSYQ